MTPPVPLGLAAQFEQVDRAAGAPLSEAAIPDDLALPTLAIQDGDGVPARGAVPSSASVDHTAVNESLDRAQAYVAAGWIEQVVRDNPAVREKADQVVRALESSEAYRTQCGISKPSSTSLSEGCVGAAVGTTWVRRRPSSAF